MTPFGPVLAEFTPALMYPNIEPGTTKWYIIYIQQIPIVVPHALVPGPHDIHHVDLLSNDCLKVIQHETAYKIGMHYMARCDQIIFRDPTTNKTKHKILIGMTWCSLLWARVTKMVL